VSATTDLKVSSGIVSEDVVAHGHSNAEAERLEAGVSGVVFGVVVPVSRGVFPDAQPARGSAGVPAVLLLQPQGAGARRPGASAAGVVVAAERCGARGGGAPGAAEAHRVAGARAPVLAGRAHGAREPAAVLHHRRLCRLRRPLGRIGARQCLHRQFPRRRAWLLRPGKTLLHQLSFPFCIPTLWL
jgi:hypothetical protein